ncbi:MAG: flagellar basal body rod protein FlgB [Candidatus Coatesbacteria bacterium]|nr:MAG: flagellar basal body rod protein FlgB [Candidatus Coatesbacteria bacterium]
MQIADNPVLNLLGRALDICSRRASLVASNVANVDTPGYKAKTFDFDAALAASSNKYAEMQPVRTDPRHMCQNVGKEPVIDVQETESPGRDDGNTVNIEQEMADLLESELMFTASSKLIAKKIQMLKTAIS